MCGGAPACWLENGVELLRGVALGSTEHGQRFLLSLEPSLPLSATVDHVYELNPVVTRLWQAAGRCLLLVASPSKENIAFFSP